jgi:hypothetical protein
MEENEMDNEDLEALEEMDKDCEASNDAEIQHLAQEVDEDMQFFVGTGEWKLGEAALLKVCMYVTVCSNIILIETR